MTDGQTDRWNCDSICAVSIYANRAYSIYAVARKKKLKNKAKQSSKQQAKNGKTFKNELDASCETDGVQFAETPDVGVALGWHLAKPDKHKGSELEEWPIFSAKLYVRQTCSAQTS